MVSYNLTTTMTRVCNHGNESRENIQRHLVILRNWIESTFFSLVSNICAKHGREVATAGPDGMQLSYRLSR